VGRGGVSGAKRRKLATEPAAIHEKTGQNSSSKRGRIAVNVRIANFIGTGIRGKIHNLPAPYSSLRTPQLFYTLGSLHHVSLSLTEKLAAFKNRDKHPRVDSGKVLGRQLQKCCLKKKCLYPQKYKSCSKLTSSPSQSQSYALAVMSTSAIW
jgi:hypothetical protein